MGALVRLWESELPTSLAPARGSKGWMQRVQMYKNRKKYLVISAMGISMANGYWASLTQNGSDGNGSLTPVIFAVLSVWVCYFSVTWLLQGMRSR